MDETQPAARPSVEHVAVTVASLLGVETIAVGTAFQHVVGWDIDESEQSIEDLAISAHLRGSQAMISRAAELGVSDFALLIDGVADGGWTYQAEIGVITEAEVHPRLTRSVGRSVAYAPFELTVESSLPSYPAVGTFVDSYWVNTDPWIPLENATDQVTATSCQASKLAEKIHHTLHS
ncbi:hypothetical protein ACFWU5_10755 [Nocardia sp. NPDC058640]|uniref:hypothetical protein n=1 Tax=Nocardia sp. NPDC058640 TaxID=3346571 RepID=UPI003669D7AD